ncbi:MAG: hypothetical protein J4O01_01105 [Chloroflexi bacterium]|nr:hypothetical protein [Chloroflexota bacterium]MCI0776420.1 hypothetical protein [Chloroflexota bacterium]MCI0809750.1 hypothetical protein [Chloroflexota bacterium]MCI0835453.1 hypothetical protein [Chloroflexota bacterium]MCI0837658.1 hypothetical protein [Chloroflexota bacterium]
MTDTDALYFDLKMVALEVLVFWTKVVGRQASFRICRRRFILQSGFS